MPIPPFNRRELLKAGLGGALAIGAASFTSIANATSPDIAHGSRSKPQVALTFHGNGDIAMAHKLLAIFEARKVPITVFAVGTWLKANPTIAKTIVAAGHDIGNHTYSHTQMKTISAPRVNSEISLCAKELTSQIGNHGSFFRPSGTQNSTTLIRSTALKYGYKKCISYDVDSLDYQDPGKATVLKAVANSVKNGSIISLHFGHQDTIDAMPTLLDQLQANGLTPVTLTTMLGKI
jgi:peptidoglycan/xylan/chitin deacetylase (PgdA/CDA1 family)